MVSMVTKHCLHVQQITIAQSIVTPLQGPRWDPTCAVHDWLVAWAGVIGLKKFVIVLCLWDCVVVLFFNNFFPCLLSSSKNSPKQLSSTKSCGGADPCSSVIQVGNISLDHFIFSTLVIFRWYSNGDCPVMLKPCDTNRCVSTYQQWLSPFSESCFDGIIANLECLHLGSSQINGYLLFQQGVLMA